MDTPRRKKLRLDQFLKLNGLVGTGGEAKHRIQAGEVQVNGETDTRRGRGLQPGDVVVIDGTSFTVEESLWDDSLRSQTGVGGEPE